jgi:3-hydroxybutyryl-CoA dehydratase
VKVGDTVTAVAEVTAYRKDEHILTLQTSCTNQHGDTVVEGEAVLLVDPPPRSQ